MKKPQYYIGQKVRYRDRPSKVVAIYDSIRVKGQKVPLLQLVYEIKYENPEWDMLPTHTKKAWPDELRPNSKQISLNPMPSKLKCKTL